MDEHESERRHASMGMVAQMALNNERESLVLPPGRFKYGDVVVMAIDMEYAAQCGSDYTWLTDEARQAVSGGALTIAGSRGRVREMVSRIEDSSELISLMDEAGAAPVLVLTIVGKTVCLMVASVQQVNSRGGQA